MPVITWAGPAAITYGTALDTTQLNAGLGFSGNIPGTFSYTPASGTVLDAGNSQTLEVLFTPTDTDTYASVSKDVSIDVLPKALTITGNDASKVYGDGLPAFSASAVGLVNGDTLDNLDVPVSFSTLSSAGSPVDSYAFTPAASDANYTISIADGTLSVTPAALLISADDQISTSVRPTRR